MGLNQCEISGDLRVVTDSRSHVRVNKNATSVGVKWFRVD